VRRAHGDTNFDEIRRLSNSVRKFVNEEKKELLAHLKAQHAYIERRRREGERGFIDWVGWD